MPSTTPQTPQASAQFWDGAALRTPDDVRAWDGAALRRGLCYAWSGAALRLFWPASLPQVTGLTVSQSVTDPDGSLDLDWADLPAKQVYESYRVERAPDVGGSPGTWAEIAESPVPRGTSQVTSSGLADDTKYWFRVYPYLNGTRGEDWRGAYSAEVSGTTVISAPSSPAQFSTGYPKDNAADDDGILQRIEGVPSAVEYEVYFRVGSSMGGDPVANGTLLSGAAIAAAAIEAPAEYLHDTNQAHGTVLYYQARAKNAGGVGPFGTEKSASVVKRLPGDPANVAAADLGGGTARVTWTQSTPDNETGYTVEERSKDCGGSFGAWSQVSTPAANDTSEDFPVLAGKVYQWRVKASNEAGDNAAGFVASNELTISDVPGTPTGFTATKSATNPTSQIDLAWTESGTGTHDDTEIWRSATENGTYMLRHTVAAGTVAWTDNVGDAETWWYKVREVNDCGDEGAFSAKDSATTDLAPPVGAVTGLSVSPKQATDDQLELSWNPHPDATGYDVDRAPDAGGSPGSWANVVTDHGSESYTDTGRSPNTKYWYRVRARNAAGTGDWSTAVAGTTHREAPDITAAVENTSDCPTSLKLDVTVSHLNSAGNARSEAFDVRYWDGSYTNAAQQSAGTTQFTITVTAATTRVETKYASETTWSQRTTVLSGCPA